MDTNEIERRLLERIKNDANFRNQAQEAVNRNNDNWIVDAVYQLFGIVLKYRVEIWDWLSGIFRK